MIELVSSPKTYSNDQDKALTPEETLRTVKERLAGLSLDVLARTRRIDNGRLGIPVFLSECGQDAKSVMPTRKQMGKGASVAQAEASALMELMERYGFFTFWERLPGAVRATWSEAAEMFGSSLIPLGEVIAACHDTIDEARARQILDLRRWLFVPATRIGSKDGQDAEYYLPLDLFKVLGEFNGSSAGNTEAESILQGACELVERHVCCIADREHPAAPTIAPDSVNDPVVKKLLAAFAGNGIKVLLKDFSMGMPVPTVAALAYDPQTFPDMSEIVFTAGTASSAAKAAARALTEVAQLAGDFNSRACYEASGLPKYASLDQAAWLEQGPMIPLDALPNVEAQDILKELRALAGGLSALGVPLYSVATTNPDTKVPTHYSVAPGLLFRERDRNASLGLFTGRLICEEENLDVALQALSILERVYPSAHFVPFFNGMLLLRAQEPRKARACFLMAEGLQPDPEAKALAAFYAGYSLTLDIHVEQDWADALADIGRAATLCPDMKEYVNLRGVCLFKLERYAEAAEAFLDIVTRLDKGSATDLQNLGLCHFRLGDTEKARHYLGAALAIDPSLQAARQHLETLKTAE